MEFTIKIGDELFEEPIKDAVARAVHNTVRKEVDKIISTYQNQISGSVLVYLLVYLNKRLTADEIKRHIDNAVKEIVSNRLQEMDES